MAVREFLLDVSRLVWRVWRGGLPTGIDRVCLAYVAHFATRSQAVVQRGGVHFVLSPAHSDRLFDILLSGSRARRLDLVKFWTAAALGALRTQPKRGAIYLNVGHTGLNEGSLPIWIARHHLRAIYLIHDLIPLTHPQFCRDGEAEKHRRRIRNVLASSAGVICNSHATLDELAAFADAEGLAMPPSIAAWLSGSPRPAKHSLRSVPEPYFITVGTIEGRKNHQLLLGIWHRLVADLGDRAPALLIVGQRGWKAERVLEQLDQSGPLKDHVIELGKCDDTELDGLIANSRALLMPSFAEGFGLPIVEALRIGTPVIASDLPAFREIAGDIPAYVDPGDADNWEDLIRAFMRDPPERTRQLERMASYEAPTWSGHFTKVEEWLRSF